MRRALLRLLLLGVSALLSVAALEGVLRLLPEPGRFLPYPPNRVRILHPSDEITPGVSGPSRFTTNSWGTRGPELAGEPIRILTVGGSTTADSILDDAETWTALLAQHLNARGPGSYWVTSSARDGRNSDHHLLHARYLLPRLPELDWVLYYVGANDVFSWLYQKDFDPHYLDDPSNFSERLVQAFPASHRKPAGRPWYERSEIWRRASVARDRLLSARAGHDAGGRIVQDDQLRWLERVRKLARSRMQRSVSAAKLETLPVALDAYERNLRRIVALTRASGAEPVLMAQALLHHTKQTPAPSRFWMGVMDEGTAQVSSAQLVELVDRYNQRMREVAQELGVRFVDVPALLRDETDLFLDRMHFHERGARAMADALYRELGAELARRGRAAPRSGASTPRRAHRGSRRRRRPRRAGRGRAGARPASPG